MTSATPGFLPRFVSQESASGIVLILATALALALANSPLSSAYHTALHHAVWQHGPDMAHIIKDGFMTLFFLLVGLEIKREMLAGELSTRQKAALPVFAALGGMIAPAMIYLIFNGPHPVLRQGWAIPSATDIAFAAGVMALLGRRVPAPLRIFLLALAIMDDLGAVIIIALFYSATLNTLAMVCAAVTAGALWALNRRSVAAAWPYAALMAVLWLCLHYSGIHATLAGVITATAIPMNLTPHMPSPLKRWEEKLHPWVAFGIMPLFALANAGIPLHRITIEMALDPVTLGTASGLFLGKPLGVLCGAIIALRLGLAHLPRGCRLMHLWGAGTLAGIGFTMSLFIGQLAFADQPYLYEEARLGVLVGSLASAITGAIFLALAARMSKTAE